MSVCVGVLRRCLRDRSMRRMMIPCGHSSLTRRGDVYTLAVVTVCASDAMPRGEITTIHCDTGRLVVTNLQDGVSRLLAQTASPILSVALDVDRQRVWASTTDSGDLALFRAVSAKGVDADATVGTATALLGACVCVRALAVDYGLLLRPLGASPLAAPSPPPRATTPPLAAATALNQRPGALVV